MTGVLDGNVGIALVNILLLSVLFVVAISIARLRNLFAIVMLSGIYSLVSATWYVVVDAVDVAFTEAAVGAGMSTVVLLGAMLLTSRTAKPDKKFARLGPLLVVVATGVMLIYATVDLPALGDPNSPANAGVGMQYMQINWADTGIPNVVTSVLGSYRGFDTLGETAVVFLAGLAVALLLGFGERSLAESIRREDRVPGRGQGPGSEAKSEEDAS
jgi:multicomponent Na+:H+ antiporter subunit B